MKLIILGAGGYGRTVADIARQSKRYSDILFLDDYSTTEDIIGKCSEYINFIAPDTEIYPAFGNNEGRLQWIKKIEGDGGIVPTLIHETAYVSPEATINKGTVVLPQAIINTSVSIKRGCIVNCGSIIDHGCVIEEGVHICLGAIVKAENWIPKYMKIEAGTVIEDRTYPLKED